MCEHILIPKLAHIIRNGTFSSIEQLHNTFCSIYNIDTSITTFRRWLRCCEIDWETALHFTVPAPPSPPSPSTDKLQALMDRALSIAPQENLDADTDFGRRP